MKILIRNLAGAVFLLHSLIAGAQSLDPNNKRGFEPGKTYNFSGLDSVSTFSGNLNIGIPIGQSYEIRPGFSYQFMLSYNSRVWDFTKNIVAAGAESPFGADRLSAPERYSNAGLGWLFSLGRVLAPGTGTTIANRYTYISSDGAHHEFFESIRGSGQGEDGVLYTHDGTYMRMTLSPRTATGTAVTGIKVETGDGLIHSFTGSGELIQIADRYGNWLEVVRDGLVWTFNEGRGELAERRIARFHRITFEARDSYMHANFKRRVKTIDLAAFPQPGSNPVKDRAVYTFHYADVTLDGSSCGAQSQHNVPLLERVELPDLSAFEMTYDRNEFCSSGAITNLTLPTKGSIGWEYGEYPMAREICIFDERYSGGFWDDAYPGVTRRTLRDHNGTSLQETVYTPELVPRGQTGTIWCAEYSTGSEKFREYSNLALPPKVFTNTVEFAGAKTVHYFSAFRARGTQYAVADAFESDYGLPMTRTVTQDSIPLSSQTHSESETLLRSTYVEYETDSSGGIAQINQRPRIVRTVFHDDEGDEDLGPDGADTEAKRCKTAGVVAPCWIQQASDQFDGFGHYRRQRTTSNYVDATERTTVTSYNPGLTVTSLWPSSTPWVLNTYTGTSVTEGGVTMSSAATFDQAGSLVTTQTGTGVGALLAATCRDDYGLVTSQRWLGGDDFAPPTNPCTAARRGTECILTHTYTHQNGPLIGHTAQWDGTNHLVIDETLDGNTGLPSSTRDGAGLATTYVFDPSSRLTTLTPPGLAATSYTFSNASVSANNVFTPARVEVSTVSADAALGSIRKQFQFDAAGRLWREKTLMPDDSWSVRETRYDAEGRTDSVSEMQKLVVPQNGTEYSFQPSRWTTFSNYDALGRVGGVSTPDGRTTLLEYQGDRVTSRDVSIATAAGGTPTREVAVERKDAHGRLAGVAEGGITTSYGYHVSGKLASVTIGSGTSGQTRTFGYDARGLLTNETHPELGANGNGAITWSSFDARGNARRKRTGSSAAFDLTMDYDAAGRLTAIRRTGDIVPLKQFQFEESTGRLQATARYNHDAHLGSIVVTEGWQYAASTGLPERRDTTVGTSETFTTGRTFANTQLYNDLGLVREVGYPFRTDGEIQRKVSYTYDNGLLAGVTGWTQSITYQPNGTIASVVHNGQVNETWTADPHGMARPRRITVSRNGATLWTSGDYTYDGAGNISAIGSRRHAYDAMSRLTGWKDDHGGGAYAATTLTLDAFGNQLSSATELCGPDDCHVTSLRPWSISGTTNHYTDATYDVAGNVLTDRGRTFTYDPLNMTTSVVAGGRTFVYLYSAGDERIAAVELPAAMSTALTTTWTLRGFGNELLSVRAGDLWKEDQIWRGSSLTGQLTAGGKRHYSLDHLGSPRVITDDAGTLIGTQSFAPFGAGGASDSGALQFTGHERDRANLAGGTVDLPDYAHARLLDTGRGRFLSVDPLLEMKKALRRPQMWNRYAYVSNNPLNATDPDGKSEFRLDNQLGREQLAVVSGEITMDQYNANNAARFNGAMTGLSIVQGFMGIRSLIGLVTRGGRAAANATATVIPTLSGSTAAEMMPQAMRALATSTANGAQKAAMFEGMAAQITTATKGAWNATRMAGPNGSNVFFGKAGEALVINAEGQVFRGALGTAVKVSKDVVEIAWHKLRLVQ